MTQEVFDASEERKIMLADCEIAIQFLESLLRVHIPELVWSDLDSISYFMGVIDDISVSLDGLKDLNEELKSLKNRRLPIPNERLEDRASRYEEVDIKLRATGIEHMKAVKKLDDSISESIAIINAVMREDAKKLSTDIESYALEQIENISKEEIEALPSLITLFVKSFWSYKQDDYYKECPTEENKKTKFRNYLCRILGVKFNRHDNATTVPKYSTNPMACRSFIFAMQAYSSKAKDYSIITQWLSPGTPPLNYGMFSGAELLKLRQLTAWN